MEKLESPDQDYMSVRKEVTPVCSCCLTVHIHSCLMASCSVQPVCCHVAGKGLYWTWLDLSVTAWSTSKPSVCACEITLLTCEPEWCAHVRNCSRLCVGLRPLVVHTHTVGVDDSSSLQEDSQHESARQTVLDVWHTRLAVALCCLQSHAVYNVSWRVPL